MWFYAKAGGRVNDCLARAEARYRSFDGMLLTSVAFAFQPSHFFQKFQWVNHFKWAKPTTKIFALIRVAGHQIKQILIAANDVISLRSDSQIDVWFVVRVA